jgi:hypothetical protein
MSSRSVHHFGLSLLAFIVLAWFSGHLFGADLFDNNWSFSHWKYLPTWYGYTWLVSLVVLVLAAYRYAPQLGSIFVSRRNVKIGLAGLFLLFLILQFDSFVYGGGNMRIAQIAQAPRIIFRWYEPGITAVVTVFFKLLSVLPMNENTAGVIAWRTVSFLATAASIIAAAKLTAELTKDGTRRLFLFCILLFGPQALLFFGFIGVEPVIVAATMWFSLYALRLSRRFSWKHLVILWAITICGLLFHYTLSCLLPAAIYLSMAAPTRRASNRYTAVGLGILTYVGLVYLLYYAGDNSLEFSRQLLFPEGRPPHADYGLYSTRRLGDIWQLFSLVAPIALLAKLIGFTRPGQADNGIATMTAWLLSLAGVTIVITHMPVNSIVLDLPRFVAYLTPLSFLLVLVLSNSDDKSAGSLRLITAVAVVSFWLPFAYLPVYTSIDRTAPYAETYFDKHDTFHYDGGYVFRDAFFYNRDFDKANLWEGRIPIKSPDMLNYRGCNDLAAAGEYDEALTILGRIIARNPYWTQPRHLMAGIQLQHGRLTQAKPQIDTCMMLEPYGKNSYISLYNYYRSAGKRSKALEITERGLDIFPGDKNIRTDYMTLSLQTGNRDRARDLAEQLMSEDSTNPFPYLVSGRLADRDNSPGEAIDFYVDFVRLAPRDPDALRVMDRIEELRKQLEQ